MNDNKIDFEIQKVAPICTFTVFGTAQRTTTVISNSIYLFMKENWIGAHA